MYDLVVVGGSVAGLSCALNAAKAGLKPVVVERRNEIGVPVHCAEAIVGDVLKDNGLWAIPCYTASLVTKVVMCAPNGRHLTLNLKRLKGIVLHRDKFEKYLADMAMSYGATIMLESEVVGSGMDYVKLANGWEIGGKLIVGADGMNSKIGKWRGLLDDLSPHDYAKCVQYTIKDEGIRDDMLIIFWKHPLTPTGYIWIFPKGKKTANVGLGVTADSPIFPKINLDVFIKQAFPDAEILKRTGGLVPLALPPEHIVSGNYLLIGDAARLAIPLHGGGIGHALLSGKIAAECIANHLNNGAPLEEYERIIKERLYPKLERGYRMKEKVMVGNALNRYFWMCKMLKFLHIFFPGYIERHAFARVRY